MLLELQISILNARSFFLILFYFFNWAQTFEQYYIGDFYILQSDFSLFLTIAL